MSLSKSEKCPEGPTCPLTPNSDLSHLRRVEALRAGLSQEEIERIKKSKPQNFDSAKQNKNLPPSTILCNKGCGAKLRAGPTRKRVQLSQIEHDKECPGQLKFEADMESLRKTWATQKATVHHPVAYDDDLSDALEKEEKERVCFQLNVGGFKLESSRSHRSRRTYLVDPKKVKPKN